jgi:hypothetical protein
MAYGVLGLTVEAGDVLEEHADSIIKVNECPVQEKITLSFPFPMVPPPKKGGKKSSEFHLPF